LAGEGCVTLVSSLMLAPPTTEIQNRAQLLRGNAHVGHDAAGKRAVLGDVRARAGVELACAQGDVAQRDRTAVIDAVAGHLRKLGAPGRSLTLALHRARQVEAAEHAAADGERAVDARRLAQLGRLRAAHREPAAAL